MTAAEPMGDRIRRLRTARGLTQRQVAEACGVTKAAVSNWETGCCESIRLVPAYHLMRILGTDLHYLVDGRAR